MSNESKSISRHYDFEPVWVDDVTENPEQHRIARSLVAASYARLSSRQLSAQDVYDELCDDAYHLSGRSRTLLATGINPNSGAVEALGTVRTIIVPRANNGSVLAPLEIMSLVEPPGGWRNFSFDGFDAAEAAELSRFAIAPSCRNGRAKECGLTRLLTWKLFQEACSAARRQGSTQFWAIMPLYVAKVTQSAGLSLNPAPTIQLNFRRHREVFERYDRYWLHCSPSLYRMRSATVRGTPQAELSCS